MKRFAIPNPGGLCSPATPCRQEFTISFKRFRRDNRGMPSHREKFPTAPPGAPLPLTELELAELQSLLDGVPAPLEPLDVSMLDGFLCGVLVQPRQVPMARWLAHLTDADGRALPRGFDATRLHALSERRYAELNDAIVRRQWFDPWVFELAGEADESLAIHGVAPSAVNAVYPWVAGFAAALELFPQLMQGAKQDLNQPLALLYRHLDPDDLEDADELIEEIESLEPPADLSEAVEGLVRATLLLADVGRPVSATVDRSAPMPSRPGRERRAPRRPH